MDRLTSMAVYIKVADSGSFAAASVALGISAQMVAKHVAYLEAHIGTRLVNRTTRRQSLTEIGKDYYVRCKSVLADVEWADSLADQAAGVPRGRLRINAPVSFGAHSLTPVVAEYLRLHPEVQVDLVLSDRLVDLIDEGFEAVFRIGPRVGSSLQEIELSPFQLIACASPAYLREHGIPSSPADLSNHECVGFANWPEPTVTDWRFVRSGRTFKVAIRSRLKVNNAAALLQAALAGFGLVLIAEDLARAPLSAGHLVRVLPNHETPSRPMRLLFQPERRQTPKLSSFVKMVVAQLGPRSTTNIAGARG